jgi:hypothetical protein
MQQPPTRAPGSGKNGHADSDRIPPAGGTGVRLGSLHVPDEAAVDGELQADQERQLASVHQPTGNRYGGYGGLRDGAEVIDEDRPQRNDASADEREYRQWRDEQLRSFEEGYRSRNLRGAVALDSAVERHSPPRDESGPSVE